MLLVCVGCGGVYDGFFKVKGVGRVKRGLLGIYIESLVVINGV